MVEMTEDEIYAILSEQVIEGAKKITLLGKKL
jgi:hypothetical protein